MLITDDPEHWKIIKQCQKDHGNKLDRVTSNGLVCMQCKYTVINGVYRKL